MVEFSVSGNSDGAALQAWKGLPSVESVRDDDGMVSLNVKQPHLTIPALLETIDRQGQPVATSDHAPGEFGRCICAFNRTPSARRIGRQNRNS